MPKEKWKLTSYQNEEERWFPRAEVYIEKDGKTETVVVDMNELFDYDEQKEADDHARYLAKDYLAKHS